MPTDPEFVVQPQSLDQLGLPALEAEHLRATLRFPSVPAPAPVPEPDAQEVSHAHWALVAAVTASARTFDVAELDRLEAQLPRPLHQRWLHLSLAATRYLSEEIRDPLGPALVAADAHLPLPAEQLVTAWRERGAAGVCRELSALPAHWHQRVALSLFVAAVGTHRPADQAAFEHWTTQVLGRIGPASTPTGTP